LSCQTVNGKTICLPVDSNVQQPQQQFQSDSVVPVMAVPVAAVTASSPILIDNQPKSQVPPPSPANLIAEAQMVKALQDKVVFEEQAKTNAVEMAKQMVETVRDETKKIVSEVRNWGMVFFC
jgi:hypothetical protein